MADTMISPGVYSQIFSLSSYLSATPGSIGFVPVITEKGKDNVLYRCTGLDDFLQNFGEPDIRTFGKYYGCGPYIATQHLSVSNDLYVVRCLPDDAIYAHTFIYFADIPDFPTDKKFAELYKGYLYDPTSTVEIDVWLVDDSVFDGTTVKAVKTAHPGLRFFDEEFNDTDKADDVRWTNDINFAEITGGNPYYTIDGDKYRDVETNTTWKLKAFTDGVALDSEGNIPQTAEDVVYVTDLHYSDATELTDGKAPVKEGNVTERKYYRELAIADGVAFNADLTVYDSTAEGAVETDAVYTSDPQYSIKNTSGTAVIEGFFADDSATFTRETKAIVQESTTSSADNNASASRNQLSFYNGNHIGLSAFSVEPGVAYPVTSDVTCFVQSSYKGSLYTVKSTSKQAAFERRVGYNANKYLELDSADNVVYTSHAELADPEDTLEEVAEGIIPVWNVDPEPWYVIGDGDKKANAIISHNAYDKYGFLTTSEEDAVYCADLQYAKIENDQFVTETLVALKSPVGQTPALQKFKRGVGKYIYVLDKTIGKEKIQMLCATCQAFDSEGYPTMDWTKAVLTSCAGKKELNEATAEYEITEWYAKTDLTPKMSTTQKLDALFYGNDTLIDGVINVLRGKTITTQVYPHEAILGYVRAVGRGDYYNDYSIKIVSDANPANFGTYKFQVFELQDGVEALAESFNVSFDPTALDGDGESLYFADVINKFSTRVVVEANENAVTLFKNQIKAFYENDPTLEGIADDYTLDNGTLLLNTAFPVVPRYDTESDKVIGAEILPEGFGYKANVVWEAYYAKAWAEKATANAAERYNKALDLVNAGAEGATVELGLAIDEMNLAQDMTVTAANIYAWATSRNLMDLNDSDPLATGEQPYYLQNGSMGSLIDNKGVVNAAIGNQILSYGYTGLLKNPVVVKSVDESTGMIKYKQQYTDNVYDLDWIYFSIVYDPGYKPDVKQAALDLVDTYRRDCVLISDCTDNADYEDCLKYVGAIKGAADAHMWNTYLAARYEPYSRIYDKFTGKDIWVSPVYHMAKMIPQNDALYDLWYASAGFRRGTVAEIKELRYSPNKSMRDQLYLAQVNPIVHFPEGMTVWGMLTTQKKNDALSDLPAVRTLLYIKRALEQYCRNYIFEFNDSTTWGAIQSECSSFLSQIQSAGGIEDYSIDVGATDYELKTKTCHVNVTLTMRRILEKIKLNFYVQ